MNQAMVLESPGQPLQWRERPAMQPGPGQVVVRVAACGVCRTDLHLVDGELPQARLPVVPGHEVVGRIAALGAGVAGLEPGQRVGVPWLWSTCGECRYCRSGHENLCQRAEFTGCTRDGGYATQLLADARYAFPLPAGDDDLALAPLLCAGLIGWRAYRMAADARVLGLYGFGAAAHLLAQVAVHQGRRVHAFTRPGDAAGQRFARSLGAAWSGDSTQAPPEPLDAALLFAPVGALVPLALRAVRPGGRVVCAGIHMSDIPSFPYADLWGERQVLSVANLTRDDALEFFPAAAAAGVHARVTPYGLRQANEALADLRAGRFEGAAVLRIGD